MRRRGATPSRRSTAVRCSTSRGVSEAQRRRCSCATASAATATSGATCATTWPIGSGSILTIAGTAARRAPRDPARVTIEDLADDVACVLDDALVDRAVLDRPLDGRAGRARDLSPPPRPRRRARAGVRRAVASAARRSAARPRSRSCCPTIQKWIHRVPGVINRVTRALLPTRLAYEIASRLEIRRELVEPATSCRTSKAWRASTRGCSSRCCPRPGSTRPTICSRRSTVPTLVVAGERDGFTPPERSRAMAAAIPGRRAARDPERVAHRADRAPASRRLRRFAISSHDGSMDRCGTQR